jgi:predicted N-acetyltransferase YhbS
MTDDPDHIRIRPLVADDLAAVAALHAEAFGPGRFSRTAYRIREGAANLSLHCHVATRAGELVGAVTMTEIAVGTSPAAPGASTGHWLLGPLAVRSGDTNNGLGQQLIAAALQSVTDLATPAATVILVGDLAYYSRFKFEAVPRGQLALPGPVDPARLLIWRGPDSTREIPSGLVQSAQTSAPPD